MGTMFYNIYNTDIDFCMSSKSLYVQSPLNVLEWQIKGQCFCSCYTLWVPDQKKKMG